MATDAMTQQLVDVVTPAAGESVTEGTLLEWHVKVGDPIKADETIVEISTDKVDVELPSPATGVVAEILIEEGETVTVGQVIARIDVNGGGPPEGNGQQRAAAPSEQTSTSQPASAQPPTGASAPEQPPAEQAPPEQAPPEAPAASSDGATGTIVDVVTPAAGESVTEGTILEWHVKVGDSIKADETIVEISTDKVDVELPAPASGTVTELLVQEGDTVTVGQVIARIALGATAPTATPPTRSAEPQPRAHPAGGDGARPDGARPDGARPDGARPDGGQLGGAKAG